MDRLRIGIIGAGHAAEQHCEAVKRVPGLEVAGVCEPVAGVRTMPEWATSVPFVDLDQLLSNPCIHVAAICTPPGTHALLAIEALRRGKAVIVEKPVASSTVEL